MKKWIFLLSVLLCATNLRAAKPRDWAQYGRYESKNAELVGTPVEVVFMGNSITDCWISNDPEFFAKNKFIDRGISGQTTCEMLARFRRDVIDLHPKAVVILAGINDIAQNNGPISVENMFGNIVSMCELAEHNGIRVVLCSLLPCERLSWRPEVDSVPQIEQLNGLLKAYAAKQKNVTYVDYHAALVNDRGGMDKELSFDGCHPTLYGYTLMEPMVVEGIDRALRLRKSFRYVTPIPENHE